MKSRINKLLAKKKEKILFLEFCMQNQGAHESPTAAHGSQVRIPVVEEKKMSTLMKLSA